MVLGKLYVEFLSNLVLLWVEDCNEAHDDLVKEIEMAKKDLLQKGVKLWKDGSQG